MAKYTDEQIKKALECCEYGDYAKCHYECPYKANCSLLTKDALDFINRQEAEIERLREENEITERNAVISFADTLVIAYSYQPITPERKKVVNVDTIISLVKDLTCKEMEGE